jgi:hypothetical protein
LVFVAYAYIWRKGGFDWAHSAISPVDEIIAGPVPEPDAPGLDAKAVADAG